MSLDPSRALVVVRLLLRAFFRRVEVSGLEHVPAQGGGIVVAWHPNGMVDPALVLSSFPRRIVFGARHGLFRIPGLGALMKALGTVPIYRAADSSHGDDAARRAANQKSLEALAREVANGSFSALFPEGESHDDPRPRALRPGAARLYYLARQRTPSGAPLPVIIPAGLHYDDKHVFRSSALVRFHPPIELGPELDVTPEADEDPETEKERTARFLALLDTTLADVVGATDDWRLHHAVARARKLVRAERAARAGLDPGRPELLERAIGFARVRAGYLARQKTHPEEVASLRRRVEEYDADLRTLGLDDHDLDKDPRWASPWLAVLLGLQLVGVFFLLPPIVLVGYAVNLPTVGALWLLARAFSRKVKDEATVKLLCGAVLFPITWTLVGLLAVSAHESLRTTFVRLPAEPAWAFVSAVLLAMFGGAIALRYLRLAREAARGARVRLTRRLRQRAIARLRTERAALCDELLALAAGLDLPGRVQPDGRIV